MIAKLFLFLAYCWHISGQYIYSVFHNKAAVRTWRNIPRFLLLSDEVDFSISFIRWLRSFSCSLPILLKTTLPMWSAYPFLPQQSCSQDMKKFPRFLSVVCWSWVLYQQSCCQDMKKYSWRNIPRFLSVIWRSWVFYQFCVMIVKLFLFLA